MKRGAISLDDFERKFAENPDPWRTWNSRYERVKRAALGRAVGTGKYGRVLELAAGNGSNTPMLAARSLRLTSTEGTSTGVQLVRKAAGLLPRVKISQLALADRFPDMSYDLIVISEVLYYLSDQDLNGLARETARRLRPNGALVLAHHCETFSDAARSGLNIHQEFLRRIDASFTVEYHNRSRRYALLRVRRMS
ncbi:MAG: class I SAM-dependent methyltransferase [Hyphomonas sp.]|jgi:SAM-dependent methyltransferase|uniref:class I SAM-dependent methyltransferase n=1 Tax=Hyphomonas sp. TaxID=87 RepID=UPI003297A4E2